MSDNTYDNDEKSQSNERLTEKTLTWSEFLQDLAEMENASNMLHDGWTIQGKGSDPGCIYLRKIASSSSEGRMSATCEDFEDSVLEQDDESEARLKGAKDVVTLEYHLLYSLSYQVPILYFNAWRPNGEFLSIEEIWTLACPTLRGALKEARWGAISQQDHPILGTPYFFFHPCNSAQLLANVAQDGRANKVIAWLSVVAPLVGLAFSIEYLRCTEKLRKRKLNKSTIL